MRHLVRIYGELPNFDKKIQRECITDSLRVETNEESTAAEKREH